jgi:hypothetical protein
MQAMTIHFAIEQRCLSQGCKQWPFILQLSDVSPKDASNDHFAIQLSLSSKDPINDDFAIELSLARRRKQMTILPSSDLSPKDAKNLQ